MKRKLTVAAILLTLIFLQASGHAQQARKSRKAQPGPTTGVPTVDQIIDRYVEAIGGEAAHRKLTSRVTKGTVIMAGMQNLTGTTEAYEKAPNKSAVVLNIPGLGSGGEGYDGSIGWSQEMSGEVRLMTGAELIAAKVDSDFYKEIRRKELFPRLTLKGTARVGNRPAYKLEGVSADGYFERMYFDVESGLLIRTDSVEEGPEGRLVLEIHYEDYREVDGVRIPFMARHRSPELSVVFRVREVTHNVPIEDGRFEKPSAR
jgi:hypothetical protein